MKPPKLGPFPEDELPTKPTNPEYRAALLVRAWRELSERDKLYLEKLVAIMAYSREKTSF